MLRSHHVFALVVTVCISSLHFPIFFMKAVVLISHIIVIALGTGPLQKLSLQFLQLVGDKLDIDNIIKNTSILVVMMAWE